MARQAQLATGEVLEFPDETPDAVMDAAVKRHITGGGSPAAPAAPRTPVQAPQELSFAERFVAPALEKVMPNGRLSVGLPGAPMGTVDPRNNPVTQGMADPGTAIAQIVASLLPGGAGDSFNGAVASNERDYQASRGEDAGTFDMGRLLTNILNPLAVKGMGALATPATKVGRAVQGAGVGTAAALTTPVTDGGENFAKDKMVQGATGATLGAVASPLADLATKFLGPIAHGIDARLPGGAERAAGRLAVKASGDRAPAVVAELDKPQTLVPGSQPTAGEAATGAGSAEFSGLEKLVRSIRPSDFLARSKDQAGARRAAVQTVGKTPADLKAAEVARGAEANKNYGAAYTKEIKADPELAQLAANPYFKKALPVAEDLAAAEKIDAKSNLTQFLHFVKLGMDARLKKTGEGALADSEKRATAKAKEQLVAWLEKKNPDYEKARAAFADASKPINQMEVGQQLESKLVAPLNDAERAGSFANAVHDAPGTIKRSTGNPRADKLDDVLTPDQVKTIESVSADLSRKAAFEEAAKKGESAARKAAGADAPTTINGYLERTVTLFNSVMKRIDGREIAMKELAKKMQNPAEMARIMKAASPSERQNLKLALTEYATAKTGASAVSPEPARVDAPEPAAAPAPAPAAAPVAAPKAPDPQHEDAPADAAKRVAGTTYKTPRGSFKWTGKGWTKP